MLLLMILGMTFGASVAGILWFIQNSNNSQRFADWMERVCKAIINR